MGVLNLAAYKPVPATPGDANQVANGFTAIEGVVNAITQANMGAGNKTTASAMSGGPPASPADGDIWIALAVDANGTVWKFRYNAGSGSAYKWEFIGGPDVAAMVAANESTASLPAVDLATVGPSITLARAGEYYAELAASMSCNVATTIVVASLFQNAALVVSLQNTLRDAGVGYDNSRPYPITSAAADVWKLKYNVNANTGSFSNRVLKIRPTRIA